MGQRVEVGTLVGTSGQSDSRAESTHLHPEIRVLQPNGSYGIADPAAYLVPAPAPQSPPLSALVAIWRAQLPQSAKKPPVASSTQHFPFHDLICGSILRSWLPRRQSQVRERLDMQAQGTTFPEDKHARLIELEVDEEILRRALGEGLLARLNCTENHPPAYRGMVAWGESTRALRDELAPFGWVPSNESNSAMVVNEAGDIGILIVLGDGGTGDETKNVSTKYARGPRTFQQVRTNAVQLSYLETDTALGRVASDVPQRVWMLLHHLDLSARELRCELSFPIRIGDDARPDIWQERIILDAIPIDADELILPSDSDLAGPDIDIVIEKRG